MENKHFSSENSPNEYSVNKCSNNECLTECGKKNHDSYCIMCENIFQTENECLLGCEKDNHEKYCLVCDKKNSVVFYRMSPKWDSFGICYECSGPQFATYINNTSTEALAYIAGDLICTNSSKLLMHSFDRSDRSCCGAGIIFLFKDGNYTQPLRRTDGWKSILFELKCYGATQRKKKLLINNNI